MHRIMAKRIGKWPIAGRNTLQIIIVLVILRNACGNPTYSYLKMLMPDAKIVGGSPTEIKEHPYMVSLQLNGHHFCGGTIINTTTILTAAHCAYIVYEVGGVTKEFQAKVGVTDQTLDVPTYSFDRVKIHPGYHMYWDFPLHDVALVLLKDSLKLNENVATISLLNKTDKIPGGTTVTAVGWGMTSLSLLAFLSGASPKLLMSVDSSLLDEEECKGKYPTWSLPFMTGIVCAYKPGKGVLFGDSGGPLMVNGNQIGISSFVILGGESPDYFTEVAAHRDWIDNNKASMPLNNTIFVILIVHLIFLGILVAGRLLYRHYHS